jgi:hypothetical protein
VAPQLKSKLSIAALIISGLAFLSGASLLCYCPGTFAFAAIFAFAAVVLACRWRTRGLAICLCAASVAMAIHHYERKQSIDRVLKAVRAKAGTNAVSR